MTRLLCGLHKVKSGGACDRTQFADRERTGRHQRCALDAAEALFRRTGELVHQPRHSICPLSLSRHRIAARNTGPRRHCADVADGTGAAFHSAGRDDCRPFRCAAYSGADACAGRSAAADALCCDPERPSELRSPYRLCAGDGHALGLRYAGARQRAQPHCRDEYPAGGDARHGHANGQPADRDAGCGACLYCRRACAAAVPDCDADGRRGGDRKARPAAAGT